MAEGLGTISSPTWKTYREITTKDLYWVDHGIKPDNIDKVVFTTVGDGVILRRTFGDHIVSSSEIKHEPDFSVYPNPASTNIHVLVEDATSENISASLYNSKGLLVQELNFEANDNQHELRFTKPTNAGLYLIRLRIGESIRSKMVVVE